MDDLLGEFLAETTENLTRLDVELVRLEREPNDLALLGNIFRVMHTIKGTCGFIGLPRLESLAHAGENVLGKFRDGIVPVTPPAVTLILKSIDAIKCIVGELGKNQKEPEGNDDWLIDELHAITCERPKILPASAAQPIKPIDEDRVNKEPAAANQTIRVRLDQLENMMNTVSELVLTRNQLLQILRAQKETTVFAVPLQRLNQVTSELQDSVMKTRMQPVGNGWSKLPRLVRDLSAELGKKIDLQMRGEETELDRQVLELIKDPLTHMVRNSADHGIEMPADRVKAGKPETGTIRLNACHESGRILIEISDDGRGLALAGIKAKALQNGLVTEAELVAMSDRQIMQFIFKPGFSTAAKVTAVSGRGVGMDVVRTNIEKIGGTIDMQSAEGKGSCFLIKIPLTLAIIPALIIECGGERFAIPQIGVTELVRTSTGGDQCIELINNAPVLRLRNRLLPLIDLRKFLNLGDAAPNSNAFVAVVQAGNANFGVIVDQVHDAEEIVVKPLSSILRHINIFSGNTILGDGNVVLILDLNSIAAQLGASQTEAQQTKPPEQSVKREMKQSLLLFRSGAGAPKAVPLSLVARIEDISCEAIEISNDAAVTQYRGKLMPLVPMNPEVKTKADKTQPVLVFTDRDRNMGLMVDSVVDIVEDRIQIDLSTKRPGYLGTSIIAGKATDIIDAAYFLSQAFADWFGGDGDIACGSKKARRILLVDDSPFFRNLLSTLLSGNGYMVATAENAARAFEMEEAGEEFDLIISDIEMPGMSGFDFAAKLRHGGRWSRIPIVALSSHATPGDVDRGRRTGFSDYIAKSNREALLASLQRNLNGADAGYHA